MRKLLAAITVLVAALVVAPASAAAVPGDADRAGTADRIGTDDTLKQRVLTITNNKRRARGCSNLRANRALGVAAQRHSNRMAAYYGSGHSLRSSVIHQLPGEPALQARIRNAGYGRIGSAGENVAGGQTTARAVMRTWMRSAGHRRNILKCSYRHIGIGLAWHNGVPFWTQVFARH